MLCQQGSDYPPVVEFFIAYPELYAQDQLFLNNLTYSYLNELNRSIQNALPLRSSRSAADKETAHKSRLLNSQSILLWFHANKHRKAESFSNFPLPVFHNNIC